MLRKIAFQTILVTLLFPVTLFSQELKIITFKEPRPDKVKEVFQVYKKYPDIKHGFYKRYKYGVLVEGGFYKDDKKDSTWNIYTLKGQLIASGNYKNDKQTGIWHFYSPTGILVQKYDYDIDSLLFFNVAEEKKFGPASSIYPDTAFEQLPIFIGGISYLNTIIANNMKYPREAWSRSYTTKIYISFHVDTEGNTVDVKSLRKEPYGFDDEGIRIVKLLGKGWIPGVQKGRKVIVQYNLPLNFDLR